jgi:hypothetical protein
MLALVRQLQTQVPIATSHENKIFVINAFVLQTIGRQNPFMKSLLDLYLKKNLD